MKVYRPKEVRPMETISRLQGRDEIYFARFCGETTWDGVGKETELAAIGELIRSISDVSDVSVRI